MGVREWWRNVQARRELGRQAAERIAAGEQGSITVRSREEVTSTRTFTVPADGDLSSLPPEVRAAVQAAVEKARAEGGHATLRYEVPPEA